MKAMILAVSLFMPVSFYGVASAQLTKVTVGNNAISGNGLPVWMAIEAGIFRKNGLEVQLVYFRGGTITAMALVARETPISQVSGPPIVSAFSGADAVVAGKRGLRILAMSRPEIKTAEQLKGGSIAIATFGGQADFISRIALQKLGLTVKDVHRTDRTDAGAAERLSQERS
jgi:NitT/TauT family transport system substrate-binding protein